MRKHQTGAALLAVLVVSISLSVLMGYTSIRMQQRLAVAEAAKVKLTDLAAVTQKLSELTYLLATQRITAAGVSQGSNAEGIKKDDDGHWLYQLTNDELRADGHKYHASGVEFSIQNESGLIPINSSTQYWLKKWLSSNGFDYSRQNKFAAIVADYADPDETRRYRTSRRLLVTISVFSSTTEAVLTLSIPLVSLQKMVLLLPVVLLRQVLSLRVTSQRLRSSTW